MIHKETIHELSLTLDDDVGEHLVAVEFEIEYELKSEGGFPYMWGGVPCLSSQLRVSSVRVQPVTVTFRNGEFYCRDRDKGPHPFIVEAFADEIRDLGLSAESGELSLKLIERGDL